MRYQRFVARAEGRPRHQRRCLRGVFGGVPGRILSAWSAGKLVIVLSPAILEEYRRVGHELGRQHPDVSATFEPILTFIAMNAMIIDAPQLSETVSDDPDDECSWPLPLPHRLSLSFPGTGIC